MKYYKTVGGMLSAAFSEMGEVDDNGNAILPDPNDNGMTESEFIEWKKEVITNCLAPFRIATIIQTIKQYPNDWHNVVTKEDLELCYKEGTEEQVEELNKFID